MTQLAIIRHGHTSWNRAGRIQGRTDIPLEETAASELGRLRLPDDWGRASLVSSPLKRAVETARLIGDRVPATDAALTEMDWGQWEGLHGLDLKRGLEVALHLNSLIRTTEDFKEGVSSFLEKRKPEWKGR